MTYIGTGNRNKDIIWLLEFGLDIGQELAGLQRNWGDQFLYFKASYEADYHSTKGHFADELFQDIYQALLMEKVEDFQSGFEPAREIALQVMDEKECQFEIITKHLPIAQISYLGHDDKDDKNLAELLRKLDRSFLVSDTLASLKGMLKVFLEIRNELLQGGNPFPAFNLIEDYLESYYQLLTFLMVNDQLLEEIDSDILHLFLRLDCYDGAVSLLSPMALNNLRRMYLGVESYFEKVVNSECNSILYPFYKSVICNKIQHAFRWFVNGESGQLMHAAVTPYANMAEEINLKVNCRNIQEYNSYEGIGELRTAEKILYEIERRPETEANAPFRIAILGDVNQEPMEELVSYLEAILRNRDPGNGLRLRFHIYSKNFKESASGQIGEFSFINYYDSLDEIFTDSELMGTLLREHDVIFMMDCARLYCQMDCIR